MLTVLSVAYPLARVAPDAVGGAEQVLAQLDAALVRAGHRSLVVALEDSQVAGELLGTPRRAGPFDAAAVQAARARTRRAIDACLKRRGVDLVHLHGVDFHAYLPDADVPTLVTLHCPREWYGAEALYTARPDTYLNAVSVDQHLRLLPNRRLLPPVDNGIPLPAYSGRQAKRGYALMLSRIAPEKGVHIALDAARRAGIPLIIAGELFPYPEHQRYFRTQVAPRLDRARRLIGPVGGARKRRLLAEAQCLVVCSQVAETSSLAAREALAAGTPVVALRYGALPAAVEHGRTGLLVDAPEELPRAMVRSATLDPAACRRSAEQRFDAALMTSRYLEIYRQLVARHRRRHDRHVSRA